MIGIIEDVIVYMITYFSAAYWLAPVSFVIAVLIMSYTLFIWGLGWAWERRVAYPKPYPEGKEPKVTVVIASYKSADTIGETIESVLKSKYENKEIIVVDDTPNNSVADVCKSFDVRVIHNKKREGKARSLNKAIKNVKTDLFLFLDSDSIIDDKFIGNLAAWFRDGKVGAASPRFDTKNRDSTLGRFTSFESSFWFTLARSHMYFGSMISFRGCGVMVRASALENVGGWDETLVEDMALAGKLLAHGYVIAHDPRTTVYTEEPETLKSFYRQRFRWGKGGLFAFLRNKRVYARLKQVIIGMVPHALMVFMLLSLILYHSAFTIYTLIPFSALSYLSFESTVKLLLLIGLFFSVYWVPATLAGITHTIVFSIRGFRSTKELALLVPYVLIYMPLLFIIYAAGILAGMKDRIKYGRNLNELNVNEWKK
ncbi:MAG: glycosyltransferase family 2 protein [Candidatus Micrarchaeota archaeon]|nr:glycosyltransferase family 2 protein [Candidatus Micrarchaeota archaeon]